MNKYFKKKNTKERGMGRKGKKPLSSWGELLAERKACEGLLFGEGHVFEIGKAGSSQNGNRISGRIFLRSVEN